MKTSVNFLLAAVHFRPRKPLVSFTASFAFYVPLARGRSSTVISAPQCCDGQRLLEVFTVRMYVVDCTVCCGEGREHGPPGPTGSTHLQHIIFLLWFFRRWTADVHTHHELTSVASDGGKCPCVFAMSVIKGTCCFPHMYILYV